MTSQGSCYPLAQLLMQCIAWLGWVDLLAGPAVSIMEVGLVPAYGCMICGEVVLSIVCGWTGLLTSALWSALLVTLTRRSHVIK